jgi:hypothetical protein
VVAYFAPIESVQIDGNRLMRLPQQKSTMPTNKMNPRG